MATHGGRVHKLERSKFKRRRTNCFKKVWELSAMFEDVDAYIVVRKGEEHDVFDSRSGQSADPSWPPSEQILVG
jgi:SRF-type transcription factor (DNA-binding and dimerisation domain)